MQVVNSYKDYSDIRCIQKLRLYHLSRPHLRQWRQSRHHRGFHIDNIDHWILNNLNSKSITMVDCAGWYLEDFGVSTTCLESDEIAKHYWPGCYVEPDIFTHRPTYISVSDPVVFKYPWFLKYATVDQFVNFLNVWAKSTTVIAFDSLFVQHNHLKYNLLDIVKQQTSFDIQPVNQQMWVVKP